MIRPYTMNDGSILFFGAEKEHENPLWLPTNIVPEDIIMEHFEVEAIETQIEVVDTKLEEIVKGFPFKSSRLADLAIAVSEAVSNAIRHGSNCGKHKVGINVMHIPKVMLFVGITDDAGKIDIKNINLEVSETFTTDDCGRGFLVMTHLSSVLAYLPDDTSGSKFKEILIGLEPLGKV
ncbi:MAG: ATP-binding protein [Candidatus Kerfeldbacteria bacterium]|jgi:anti-sigma regulatory factor (Ser/Thr protein kinase)